ncbi:MAG: hypothetical protein ACYTGF_02165 [Planctomycetota bacterium]|jgi:hypothetical protein
MNAERDVPSHEEGLFVDLIEDVLQATPGLRYDVHRPDARHDDRRAPYAIFAIETAPAHELTVSIELAPDEFRLRVNGDAFAQPVEKRRCIDRWIDRRCRDVEQLASGDLKIVVETLAGRYLSSDLYAGSEEKWKELGEHDKGWGWIGLIGWLLPFGLSPTRIREIVYRDWYRVDQEPEA